MKVRNADGSSTVYKVHESMDGMNPVEYVAPGLVEYNLPSPTSVMQPDMNVHGAPMPHYYSPYSSERQSSSPNVRFVESGNDNMPQNTSVPAEPSQPDTTTSPSKSRRRRKLKKPEWCSKTSNICLVGGILLALGLIVGYVFLIEAIVSRSVPTHSKSPRYGHKIKEDVPEDMSPQVQAVKGIVVQPQQLRGAPIAVQQLPRTKYIYILPEDSESRYIEIATEEKVVIANNGPKEILQSKPKPALNVLERSYNPKNSNKSRDDAEYV